MNCSSSGIDHLRARPPRTRTGGATGLTNASGSPARGPNLVGRRGDAISAGDMAVESIQRAGSLGNARDKPTEPVLLDKIRTKAGRFIFRQVHPSFLGELRWSHPFPVGERMPDRNDWSSPCQQLRSWLGLSGRIWITSNRHQIRYGSKFRSPPVLFLNPHLE